MSFQKKLRNRFFGKEAIWQFNEMHIFMTVSGAGSDRKLVCKTEEKLLAHLDQAILAVIDKAEKTRQTTAIGTLF